MSLELNKWYKKNFVVGVKLYYFTSITTYENSAQINWSGQVIECLGAATNVLFHQQGVFLEDPNLSDLHAEAVLLCAPVLDSVTALEAEIFKE